MVKEQQGQFTQGLAGSVFAEIMPAHTVGEGKKQNRGDTKADRQTLNIITVLIIDAPVGLTANGDGGGKRVVGCCRNGDGHLRVYRFGGIGWLRIKQ